MKYLIALLLMLRCAAAAVPVALPANATSREQFGAERLRAALEHVTLPGARVVLAVRSAEFPAGAEEAFHLLRRGDTWLVTGSDPSGVLYGCLELAARVRQAGALPYDGATYDYRYTPEEFPFFYDKALWTLCLDFLVEQRMNTLYLWNGHPFTSLLKLPQYPDAQELTDEQLARNMEMFRWLTAEADKRGIWVIEALYNIHISHTLARAHGVPFQQTTPSEFTSRYTRYCISEFIRTYPNVGLMMTLGEALRPQYGPEWLTRTIIPGVKDGMKKLGNLKGDGGLLHSDARTTQHELRAVGEIQRRLGEGRGPYS